MQGSARVTQSPDRGGIRAQQRRCRLCNIDEPLRTTASKCCWTFRMVRARSSFALRKPSAAATSAISASMAVARLEPCSSSIAST